MRFKIIVTQCTHAQLSLSKHCEIRVGVGMFVCERDQLGNVVGAFIFCMRNMPRMGSGHKAEAPSANQELSAMPVEDVHRRASSTSFLGRSLPGCKVCSAACIGLYRAEPEGRRAAWKYPSTRVFEFQAASHRRTTTGLLRQQRGTRPSAKNSQH